MRLNKQVMILSALMLLGYLYLFKDIFFQNKVLFPSNFLAEFYSPYRAETFPGWEQGIPHKPIGTDQIRFFAPSRQYNLSELREGRFPYWNPYIFAGNPHVANFQSSFFHPVTLLFWLFPFWETWNFIVIVQPLLAFLGMALYLKRLGLNRYSVVLGSLTFGLSGFMSTWIYENSVVAMTGLFLPYILWSFEKFVARRTFGNTLLLILFLTITVYSGFFQLAFYIYIFALLYMILRFVQNRALSLRAIVYIGMVFATSILLSAPQLFPSIEGYLFSARTKSDVSYLFETYLLDVLHLFKIFTPDLQGNPGSYNFSGKGFYHETVLFIGTIPALIALFCIKTWRNKLVLLYLIFFLVTLLFLFRSPITEFFYSLSIPLISTFVPSRLLFISTFALSVLAAFGVENFIKAKTKYVSLVFALFIFIQSAFLVIAYLETKYPKSTSFILSQNINIKNSALSIAVVIALLLPFLLLRRKQFLYFIIIILSASQLLFFHYKYMTVGSREFLYPPHRALEYIKTNQGLDRSIAIGDTIQGNILLEEKIYSVEGLDPIFSYSYGVLANSAKNQKYTSDIPRIEVSLGDQNPTEFFKNEPLQTFLRMTSVKYLLYITEEKEPTVSAALTLVQSDKSWKLYELTNRLPRVFFADAASMAAGLRQSTAMTLALKRPESTIVIEGEQVPHFLPPEKKDIVEISKYSAQSVILKSLTAGPRLVFFSDTYHPRWKAYVNGIETQIFRANTAFRAIVVPEGDTTVEFKYVPDMWENGVDFMIVGIFLLGIIWYSFSQSKEKS